MIEAGRLNERLTLLASDGQTEIATVHADVRPVTAREQLRNGAEIVTDLFTALIRYRQGLSTALKVRYKGYVYNVASITIDPREASAILTLTLDSETSGTSFTVTGPIRS